MAHAGRTSTASTPGRRALASTAAWAAVGALVCLVPDPAVASVRRVGSVSGEATAASFTTVHTVPAGTERYLVVGVAYPNDGQVVSAISFGGVLLQQRVVGNAPGVGCRAEIWGLLAPSPGAATVRVTATAVIEMHVSIVSYDGVDPLNAVANYQSNGASTTTATLTIGSTLGQHVTDLVCVRGSTPRVGSPGSNQQILFKSVPGVLAAAGSDRRGPSTNMTWGVSAGSGLFWTSAALVLGTSNLSPEDPLPEPGPTDAGFAPDTSADTRPDAFPDSGPDAFPDARTDAALPDTRPGDGNDGPPPGDSGPTPDTAAGTDLRGDEDGGPPPPFDGSGDSPSDAAPPEGNHDGAAPTDAALRASDAAAGSVKLQVGCACQLGGSGGHAGGIAAAVLALLGLGCFRRRAQRLPPPRTARGSRSPSSRRRPAGRSPA
jgi:hypothetical protein